MGKQDSYTEYTDRKENSYLARSYQPKWVLRKKSYKPLAPGVPDYAVGNQWLMPSVRPTELPYVSRDRKPQTLVDGNGVKPTTPKPRVLYNTFEEIEAMKSLVAKKSVITLQEKTYITSNSIQRRIGGQPDYWNRPIFSPGPPRAHAHAAAMRPQTVGRADPGRGLGAAPSPTESLPASLPSMLKSQGSEKNTQKSVKFGGIMRGKTSGLPPAINPGPLPTETQPSLARPAFNPSSPRGRRLGPMTSYYEQLSRHQVHQLLRDQKAKVV